MSFSDVLLDMEKAVRELRAATEILRSKVANVEIQLKRIEEYIKIKGGIK